jgi:hypothetical protein
MSIKKSISELEEVVEYLETSTDNVYLINKIKEIIKKLKNYETV